MRFRGVTASAGVTTLHFDEGNHPITPDHEVHIMAAEAEAVRFDAPTAGSEVRESGKLPAEALPMATVSPHRDGNEALSGGHGRKMHCPAGPGRIVWPRAAPLLLEMLD
jgi:hypothetical protein